MELIITESHGWMKPMTLEKAIIRIGSASGNDIQLQSPKIAPVHLQVLYSPDMPSVCRVLNLADGVLLKTRREKAKLISAGIHEISDGDEIVIDSYTLTFHLPLGASYLRKSDVIEGSLSIPDAVLWPNSPLNCAVIVKNAGNQDACQFQITMSGLPEDCFQIDPVPLMYPGAQEEVRLQLYHHTTYPEAGHHELEIHISSPEDYPGEEMVIKQGIYVAPLFKQSLELIDDIPVKSIPVTLPEIRVVTEALPEPEEQLPVLPPGEQFTPAEIIQADKENLEEDLVAPAATSSEEPAVEEGNKQYPEPELPAPAPIISEPENRTETNPAVELEDLPAPAKAPVAIVYEPVSAAVDLDEPAQPVSQPVLKPVNPQELNLAKMKVVRNQPNEFWDEE
jgi:hypothetical protein